MKEIFIYWYKMDGEKQNFGDVLGPYLVSKLSGLEAVHVPMMSKTRALLSCVYRILKRQHKLNSIFSLIRSFNNKNTLMTAGSIIEWHKNQNYDIWGSGLMNLNGNINNSNFYAVRGKYTQKRLKELGYNCPETIGDPGLLLPVVYNPTVEKTYKLGIIPHYNHYEETCKLIDDSQILVINLLDDFEKIIRDVKACNCTISSSLHGLIESHAYGIPSLWYNLPGTKLNGDNVKFLDYFSSVDIQSYSPYEISTDNKIDINQIIENVNKECNINVIFENIKNVQKNLLKAAPFKVQDKYFLNL